MATTGAGPGHSKESGTQLGPPVWMVRTRALGASTVALQVVLSLEVEWSWDLSHGASVWDVGILTFGILNVYVLLLFLFPMMQTCWYKILLVSFYLKMSLVCCHM